jgi:hypothetical protein
LLTIQTNKTLDAYKALASKAAANVAPTFGAEGGVAGSVVAPSGTAAATTGTSSPSGHSSAGNVQNVAGAAGFALAIMAVFGGMMAVF